MPISIARRSCAAGAPHARNGEPLPLLWPVVEACTANTFEERNQEMPRLGDAAACVGESVSGAAGNMLVDADGVMREDVWEGICVDGLVVGVDGVWRAFDGRLDVCGKRCDFKRRTASLIRFPSSTRRCNKHGRRRRFSNAPPVRGSVA